VFFSFCYAHAIASGDAINTSDSAVGFGARRATGTQWNVVYQPNEAILTVGPNTIPDQGSTFLLLTLGLLGLVTYRRQLLRRS
jgi:hypothetical protein